jgi:ADP-heptose:LPS heptosyltransferase
MSSFYSLQYTVREWFAAQPCRFQRRPGEDEYRAIVQDPQRVLIVIAGLLGDSVMSSPVINAARRIWPRAALTLLGQRHNCELLADCTDLDERIVTYAPFSIRRRREVRQMQEQLAARRFDIGLLVLGNHFARMLVDANIPVRVGVRRDVMSPCHTHQYEIGSPRTWGPNERLNSLRALGFEVPDMVPCMRPSATTLERAADGLRRLGIGPDEAYAAIHPFGSTQRQWWPADRVEDLRRHLDRQYGLRTVIVGGPETRCAPLDTRAVDARGQLTLTEFIGVLARAAVVVSTDSGPFHISGALGRPLIGLFRDRRPEHALRYPQARVVFGEYEACARECGWDRCAAAACRQMCRLPADRVAAALDVVMAR